MTRFISRRCGRAAGWRCSRMPEPAARWCRGSARTSTLSPPTWPSRCSRPPPRRSTCSPTATPHRLWVHPNVDLYLVTSAAAEAAVRRYQPMARVQVIPSPVRPGFSDPPSQEAARSTLGLPAGDRTVLLMSGAWGLGPLAQAAAALADAGVQVLAVAGRNARLESRLRLAASQRPRLHAFGYTEGIPT